jgi:EAL domain-containing protein (putative c-di-GMP-specific phosphodiesterase class I)
VRWEHPERGLMPPGEFIPLAEETGLIRPLGRWVLEEACRQVRAWHERHPAPPRPWLCVNLSVRQFQHPDVVDEIAATLRATGLAPDCLVLELTESVLIAEGEAAVATLGRLKALGVRLALDDFGTGYSSLGYLSRFPIDIIKIDRSFVQQLWTQREAMAIVEATLLIARKLGKTVIAEGVETEQQRRYLGNLGCELGQGYLFAQPLPPEEMEARLSAPSPDAAPLSAG